MNDEAAQTPPAPAGGEGGNQAARSRAPMWCDDFDMDLLKVLPEIDGELGDAATIQLWTYGHTSFGRINHPSAWNSRLGGFIAFFWTTKPTHPRDAGGWVHFGDWNYATHNELVECTWLEVLRDLWSHQLVANVDGVDVWDAGILAPGFNALMYDRRDWRKLDAAIRGQHLGIVRGSIIRATEQMLELAKGGTAR